MIILKGIGKAMCSAIKQTIIIMRERKQGATIAAGLIMCKETVDLTTNFYVVTVNDLVIRAACVSDTVRRKMAMK